MLGVSKDSIASHQRFIAKRHLPFALLSDPHSQIYAAFGVSGRSTFLIGPDGIIRKVWPKVSVLGHAADVLAAVTSISASH